MAKVASSVWHQIVVPDPQGLSGASVASFVSLIIRKLGAIIVVASDLVGACPGLMGHARRALNTEDFLQKVVDATQYDWGFFFLYSRTSTPEEIVTSDDKAAMRNADATIRLVDDQYFYIYTRDEGLVSELVGMYPTAEHKASSFEELDIPY